MLTGQCFCGDFGALGLRKTAFHGPAVAFLQNTLLQSRQPEKPPEGHIIHKQALFTCEGCLWPQAAESAELQIRLTEVSGTGAGIYELRRLWACAAGSSAKGSPRARQTRELRPEILKPRRSRPAGSIGLRGGSYCRRASSARGWAGQQIANLLKLPTSADTTILGPIIDSA